MLRISLVDFLNARPLTWGFLHDPPPGVSVSRDMPSVCARKLAGGDADAGLIPSIEFQRIPDLVRVEGLGIAADSEVRSVLLVSKVPRSRIRTVSLDPASRTSAVLTRLLLKEVYGLEPDYREGAAEADARLVIGDPALKARLHGQVVLDLAAEWKSWTGFPFVFAFWAVRREAWREDLPSLFAGVHRRGMDHFDAMVDEEAAQIGGDGALSRAMIEDYLRHSLHYQLTPRDEEGLSLFYRLAAEAGLLSVPTEPRSHL